MWFQGRIEGGGGGVLSYLEDQRNLKTKLSKCTYYVHLLNCVYKRSRDAHYVEEGARDLRRYEAPILKDIMLKNKSFEKSIIYQGAALWNLQETDMREIPTVKEYKHAQKCKLNAL